MTRKHFISQDSEFKPHIGACIKNEMKNKGRKVGWLAEQLNCHRNNVYLIFSRSWIDTETLFKISEVLEHDFFADLSTAYINYVEGIIPDNVK